MDFINTGIHHIRHFLKYNDKLLFKLLKLGKYDLLDIVIRKNERSDYNKILNYIVDNKIKVSDDILKNILYNKFLMKKGVEYVI